LNSALTESHDMDIGLAFWRQILNAYRSVHSVETVPLYVSGRESERVDFETRIDSEWTVDSALQAGRQAPATVTNGVGDNLAG